MTSQRVTKGAQEKKDAKRPVIQQEILLTEASDQMLKSFAQTDDAVQNTMSEILSFPCYSRSIVAAVG
jgi:hypothetical protein